MFGDPARPEGRRIDNIVYQRAEAIKRRAAGETLASSQGFPIFVEAKLYELKLERGNWPLFAVSGLCADELTVRSLDRSI